MIVMMRPGVLLYNGEDKEKAVEYFVAAVIAQKADDDADVEVWEQEIDNFTCIRCTINDEHVVVVMGMNWETFKKLAPEFEPFKVH